jgi:hypothetical protein
MAVLSKEKRLALLAQSNYASSVSRKPLNQDKSSSNVKKPRRKTGMRSITSVQIEDGRIKACDLTMLSRPESKIAPNPQRLLWFVY